MEVGTYASTDKYGEKTQGGYSTHIVVQKKISYYVFLTISV